MMLNKKTNKNFFVSYMDAGRQALENGILMERVVQLPY